MRRGHFLIQFAKLDIIPREGIKLAMKYSLPQVTFKSFDSVRTASLINTKGFPDRTYSLILICN